MKQFNKNLCAYCLNDLPKDNIGIYYDDLDICVGLCPHCSDLYDHNQTIYFLVRARANSLVIKKEQEETFSPKIKKLIDSGQGMLF